MDSQIQIDVATTEEDVAAVLSLFKEFVANLPISVDFQGVNAEFSTFPATYECLLIAYVDGRAAGAVALKDLGHTPSGERRCEMKRLYVRPEFRGLALGQKLCDLLIEKASANYTVMVLDSLERLKPALSLYERLGFVRTDAYYHNPADDVVYMTRPLKSRAKAPHILSGAPHV